MLQSAAYMQVLLTMRPIQDKAVKEAYRIALGLLARREHSRYELAQKLKKRQHQHETISDALDVLVAEGSLSEDRFTDAYVRMRRERGYGPLRICSELRERGIDDGMITHYLAIYGDEWDQYIERVYHKRFGNPQAIELKERVRQQRFLQYRGFTHEQIRLVLN